MLDGNVTTTGNQTYAGAVTIGGNDTLTTTNSTVNFAGAVNDSRQQYACPHRQRRQRTDHLRRHRRRQCQKLASLAATSSTDIDVNGNVTTGGTQTYTGPVVIGCNDTLTTTNSTVTFTSTVDDASSNTHALTVNAGSGLITFGGVVGGNAKLASLAATSSTDIDVNGNVTTGGTQTYTGPVIIGANDTLTTTNSAVDFTSTVDDASSNTHALTVSAGSGLITFGGIVGGSAKLASLAATSSTDIDINGNVTTGGTQTYTGPVVLGANDTLTTTNAAVDFTSTVDGTHTLTIAQGSGLTTFGGNVGGGTALSTINDSGTGTIDLNGNITTSNAGATLNGPVVLGGNSTISLGSGTFTTGSTVNGNYNLNATAATFSLGGAIGGTTPLNNVTLTSTNSLTLPAITATGVTASTSGAAADLTVGGTQTVSKTSGTPVSLTSGRDLLLHAAISETDSTSTDTTAVTLAAKRDIVSNGSSGLSSSGAKVNLTMDSDSADSNGSGSGAISLGADTWSTSGGNITLGGGTTPTTMAAIGDSGHNSGVSLNGTTLNAGAGSISMIGAGSINGITLSSDTLSAGNGGISITATSTTTSGDAMDIMGTSITASGTGNINMTAIETSGPSTDCSANGCFYMSGDTISTASDNITLAGQNIPIGIGGASGANTFGGGSTTGNITFIADIFDLASSSIQTTGTVTFKPYNVSTTVGVNNAGSTLNITSGRQHHRLDHWRVGNRHRQQFRHGDADGGGDELEHAGEFHHQQFWFD